MSMALFRSLFSFDPRPSSEVEDEMRAEFESHLVMLEDELVHSGFDSHAARDEARARFGDASRIAREGKSIKLGDRIMLQRINFALLILLAGVVVWVAFKSNSVQQQSLAAIQQVSARLELISADPPRQNTSQPATATRTVFIDGAVAHPGSYYLQPGYTVRKLIASAGGVERNQRLSITISRKDGGVQKRLEVPHDRLTWPEGSDLSLQPDDFVSVTPLPTPDNSGSRVSEGATGMVYVTGLVGRPGPYQLPTSGLTLKRLIDSSGGLKEGAKTVTIEHQPGGIFEPEKFDLTELMSPNGLDVDIDAGDRISIGSEDSPAKAPEHAGVDVTPAVQKLAQTDEVLREFLRSRDDVRELLANGEAAKNQNKRATQLRLRWLEAAIHKRVRELSP